MDLKSIWDTIIDILHPKEVEMYKRMEKLFYYIELCDLDKLERIQTRPIEYNPIAEEAVINFQSNLGTVEIKLIKQFNDVFSMEYANYAGTTVFTLKTGRFWVDVIPLLGDTLKARDVDLAIYELEQYLYNNLGEIDNLLEKHNQLEKETKERHKEELKLLR